jgi:hypothetical protein
VLLGRQGVLRTSVHQAVEWNTIRPVWQSLLARCPDATFFLTCEWLDSWLDTFAQPLRPHILVFQDGNEPVGACLLVHRKHRYQFISVHRVYINTAGEPPEDSPYIEFNTLLCIEGYEQEVASALRTHISEQDPDEISLDGFCSGPGLEALRSAFSDLRHVSDVRMNFYVDLNALRTSNSSYESAIGPKTRKHLRQSYKAYGDIVVEAAGTVSDSHAMLEQLSALNRKVWKMRAMYTAFESERFMAFHRALISRAFSEGMIQMLRISAGAEIGYMYNFVYRGRVYFYQSGFAYSEDKRLRPGVVCIGKAITYCLEQPQLSEFHLMPGGDHYKQSMSTNSQRVEWLLAQKTTTRIRAVDLLRSIKRKVKPLRKSAAAGPPPSED